MKAKNIKLYIFLLFVLIYQINSFAITFQDIIHIDSEYAKVCTLKDKSFLVHVNTKESKLDEKGNVIYGNSTLNLGYTGSAELVQPKAVYGSQPNYLFTSHNKQNLQGQIPNELLLNLFKEYFQDQPKEKFICQHKSTFALKNGKTFIAGIINDTKFGAITTVDVNILDAIKNK